MDIISHLDLAYLVHQTVSFARDQLLVLIVQMVTIFLLAIVLLVQHIVELVRLELCVQIVFQDIIFLLLMYVLPVHKIVLSVIQLQIVKIVQMDSICLQDLV